MGELETKSELWQDSTSHIRDTYSGFTFTFTIIYSLYNFKVFSWKFE